MKSGKALKSGRAKKPAMRMKDLRPEKDAKGGAQKKEDPATEDRVTP